MSPRLRVSELGLLVASALALSACSGRYEVGVRLSLEEGGAGGADSESAGSGGRGLAPESGDPPEAPVPVPALAESCGFAPESAEPARFAPPEVLWERISLFIAEELRPAPPMPSTATPEWAASAALGLFNSFALEAEPAPVFVRFVSNWLHQHSEQTQWSMALSHPGAKLSDLFEPAVRPAAGILTDRGFLTSEPRISWRGAWIADSLFCITLPASPPGSPPLVPDPESGMTRRDLLEATVEEPACFGCHQVFDPLGFSLEHFDELGNFRELDNGVAVDSSGTHDGGIETFVFEDATELGTQLGSSCLVARCLGEQLLGDARTFSGVETSPDDLNAEVNRIANQFRASEYDVRALIRAIVTTPSFLSP